MRFPLFVLAIGMAAAMAAPAAANNVVVKMLNRGQAGPMVFEPALVKIAPGDTVTFIAADKGHNAESIAGMIPTGSAPFRGKMSETVTVKFAKQGLYGFKCFPHYGMGMVGVVIVGKPSANLDAAKKVTHPGKARQVFANLLARIQAQSASR